MRSINKRGELVAERLAWAQAVCPDFQQREQARWYEEGDEILSALGAAMHGERDPRSLDEGAVRHWMGYGQNVERAMVSTGSPGVNEWLSSVGRASDHHDPAMSQRDSEGDEPIGDLQAPDDALPSGETTAEAADLVSQSNALVGTHLCQAFGDRVELFENAPAMRVDLTCPVYLQVSSTGADDVSVRIYAWPGSGIAITDEVTTCALEMNYRYVFGALSLDADGCLLYDTSLPCDGLTEKGLELVVLSVAVCAVEIDLELRTRFG